MRYMIYGEDKSDEIKEDRNTRAKKASSLC
jgi:hypothetical protein